MSMKRHLELATKSIIHILTERASRVSNKESENETASRVSNKEHHTYPNMSMKRHLELATKSIIHTLT